MKLMQRIVLAVAFIGVLFLGSCEKRPDGVLSEGEMVDLLTDLQLAEAYYSTSPTGARNTDRRMLEESVLKKHGVTRAQLDATLAYYGRNIDDYTKLYTKVEKKLRAQSGAGGSESVQSADDIWPYGRHAVIMPNQMSNGITFSIPAENIKPGNILELGMNLTSADGVEIMLGVEYEDGTSSLFRKTASGNKSLKVSLQTDSVMTAKRIFGVMTAPTRSMPLWTDSIRLTKSEFDSGEYSKINMQHTVRKPLTKKEKEKRESIEKENQESEDKEVPEPVKINRDTMIRPKPQPSIGKNM